MEDGREVRDRYFQEVSRAFLRLRGAPFILSGRELHVLAAWEKEGIPVSAALAGLEQAFRRRPAGAPPARGKISLVFCDTFVRRAYDQHRERAVGGRRPERGGAARRERIREEAKAFLEDVPEELPWLADLFRRALSHAEAGEGRETELERLEEELAVLLWERCPAEEREKAESQVLGEFPSSAGTEHEGRVRARVVKNLRVRHRIPFISGRYY